MKGPGSVSEGNCDFFRLDFSFCPLPEIKNQLIPRTWMLWSLPFLLSGYPVLSGRVFGFALVPLYSLLMLV